MNTKADVMQSNLPLLFTNGSPTSLESMSLVRILQNLQQLYFYQEKESHEVRDIPT